MNDECNIVYFSTNLNVSFSKQQVNVPIWFKKEADPKYICYCNQVTEQQIIGAVINDRAKDMKDIIRLTGAMKNGKCEINNPLGKCCGPIILETINKALKLKDMVQTDKCEPKAEDIISASEKLLSKDWLKPEED